MSDIGVRIEGAEKLQSLARELKVNGEKKLRRDLNKALRTAAKPITAATRAQALASLPRRGGLAKRAAEAPQKVQIRATGASASTRVRIGVAARGIAGTDKGLVRHPVFGNRAKFVNQAVKGGWFSETASKQGPEVQKELVKVIDDLAQSLRP